MSPKLMLVSATVIGTVSWFCRFAVFQVVQQAGQGKWQAAASMSERREYAGGIVLKSGNVLAVSGHPLDGKSLASAELYDPITSRWKGTGSLTHSRGSGNAAVLLADGRVLLAGGTSNSKALREVEIYDAMKGRWIVVAPLAVARDAPAVTLRSGHVLAAGGIDWSVDGGKAYDTAETYDPTPDRWTLASPMIQPRYAHRMILLDNGNVLAVGGYKQGDIPVATAEMFDPVARRWRSAGGLSSPRVGAGLVNLPDGRVLSVGGFTGPTWQERIYVADAELFDPRTEKWTPAPPMANRRAGMSVTLLRDGRVLAAGGWTTGERELSTVEIFDPVAMRWTDGPPLLTARRNHRAALLPDGRVLVIGGSTRFGGVYLRTCEIFKP